MKEIAGNMAGKMRVRSEDERLDRAIAKFYRSLVNASNHLTFNPVLSVYSLHKAEGRRVLPFD